MDTNPVQTNMVPQTNKSLTYGLIGGLLALVIATVAFGSYIYVNNQSQQKKVDDLNNEISSLKNPQATVTPTSVSNIPSNWLKFEDKKYFGITFYYPPTWTVELKPGVENNTIGNSIVVMVPRGKIDLAEGLQFNQVIGVSDGSPCDRTNCTMKDVSLLGKKYDIDISGNSSNDKKLPVNPRVKTGGVNGNLQFTFSDPVLEEAQNFTDMKIVLESITYN